jgi:hypothetical protein
MVNTLVTGYARPRCGHYNDPQSVRAGLGDQGARGFSFAFGVSAQGVVSVESMSYKRHLHLKTLV